VPEVVEDGDELHPDGAADVDVAVLENVEVVAHLGLQGGHARARVQAAQDFAHGEWGWPIQHEPVAADEIMLSGKEESAPMQMWDRNGPGVPGRGG
jgi:hypothetical protein